MTSKQLGEYELMKILEGYSDISYVCTKGKTTVGVGFNMDQASAKIVWQELGIPEDFYDVYNGITGVSEDTCYKLFNYYWDIAEKAVRTRCIAVDEVYDEMPEYKQFVLKDIVYNTGSIRNWYKVFKEQEPKKVLYQARRRQRDLDSRVAKIGKYYGLITSLEDAHNIGLTEAKYIR